MEKINPAGIFPAPRYKDSGTTIFTVMSSMAQQYNAINLSQGFPDFDADGRLGEFLLEACSHGFHQYAPMTGLPMLRNEISEYIFSTQEARVDEDAEITITPGATSAIFTAFTSILQPGDEVIVFEPAYDSYIPNIEINGARAVTIPLSAPDFSIDWNLVKDAISARTKAIILTTPHNPTGSTLKPNDWNTLAELVRNTSIIIISDEVYEQLVYDNEKHTGVLQYPELRRRAFAIYSFGKTFHITGWKIGYCIAPPVLTNAFRKIHQFLSFSVNTPAQYALARILQQPPSQPANILLQRKRDLFLSLLGDTPFTFHRPSAGSYFQLAGYSRISNLPDYEFAAWLTKNHGVAAIPVSAFYRNRKDDKIIRFCFAKKDETLKSAGERLKNVVWTKNA